MPDLSSPTEMRESLDYKNCIICEKAGSGDCVTNPMLESLTKLLKYAADFAALADPNITPVHNRLRNLTAEDLSIQKAFYHKNCYSTIVSDRNLQRAVARQQRAQSEKDASLISPKRGRPSTGSAIQSESSDTPSSIVGGKRLRSAASPYNSDLCIVCQKAGGLLHKVQTKPKGIRMLEVAKQLDDDGFLIRLNTLADPADAVANDVQYHQNCWLYAQREASKTSTEDVAEMEQTSRVISDIEILNIVKCELDSGANSDLNMNNINTTYINLLQDNNHPSEIKNNNKRYLKRIILENIPDVEVIKPRRKNVPERLCSTKEKDAIVGDALENVSDNLQHIFQAAKLVRKDIFEAEPWNFTGSFDNYKPPEMLQTLIKWIIVGPNTGVETVQRTASIDQTVENIAQIVCQSVKTDRQVRYHGTGDNSKNYHSRKETPFSVGLGLLVHKNTRSKDLVNILSDLHLTVDYSKVRRIETDIANAVVKRMSETNGVYVPHLIQEGEPVYFAIDNCDFKNDTADGKNEFHGTAQIVYQRAGADSTTGKKLQIERNQNRSLEYNPFPQANVCPKPKRQHQMLPLFATDRTDIDLYRKWDCIWFLTKTLSNKTSESVSPTWAAYNSLITDALPITIYCGLPLYPAPPTDWSNFYAALKICQNISAVTCPGRKTIISLDLQLYSKALQLQSRDEVSRNYVFRPGELHVVFAFLHAMGKYIECSGIDQMCLEADVYGPATLQQILKGKHMKRGMEAHMSLYLALHRLYMNEFLVQNAHIEDKLKSVMSVYLSELQAVDFSSGSIRNMHDSILEQLSEENIFDEFVHFDNELQNQPKFLRNYMNMYEIQLLFTRATRQGNWDLHLSALDLMIPYFFVHDLQNYARLMPVYLAQMHALKISDPTIWDYFESGNFSVNKSSCAFSAIGADHGIEQENRALKVLGGVKGLLLNKAALNRFSFVSPELNRICDEFRKSNSISHQGRSTAHYQLTGSMNLRVIRNVNKLVETMQTFDVSFNESDIVYSLISKSVLCDRAQADVLSQVSSGREMYASFLQERVHGDVSIWDKMKQRKLLTFKSTATTLNTKLQGKVVELKEDRSLMQRILVISQKRPQLDLPKLVGQYEFSIVPRSLFSFDGKLHPCTDKSKLIHLIEERASNSAPADVSSKSKVVVFDGMALVNKLQITRETKTCLDLKNQFVSLLRRECDGFPDVRLVFDRYMAGSLKERTREKRTDGKAVRYKIQDSTSIAGIKLKQLLSHIETKSELTKYLAEHSMQSLTAAGKAFVVVYDTTCLTNIAEYPDELKQHDQEEADTLIILQAKHVADTNPFSELFIVSPDTDVFLLLIHYYPQLCVSTTFRTGTGNNLRDINIRDMYEAVGPHHADAILGFHVFSGCDQTGRFYGKSKSECFRIFLKYNQEELLPFASLGCVSSVTADEILANVTKFVLDLYCRHRPDTVNSIASLRWHLFSKNQKSAEHLPPTKGALRQKVLRAHYVTSVLKHALEAKPCREDPTLFGWTLSAGSLVPIPSTDEPAPKNLIELTMCACKTKCATNRCCCKKFGLVCTDVCHCVECDNVANHEETDSESDNYESDIDSDSDY